MKYFLYLCMRIFANDMSNAIFERCVNPAIVIYNETRIDIYVHAVSTAVHHAYGRAGGC